MRLLEDDYLQEFFAATAALEVQMLVCLCVCLSVTLATTVLDFLRTSEGLPKDFGLYGLQNLLIFKSQPLGF